MRVLSVNQDRGVRPGKPKGAAVHLLAMRRAFAELGAEVVALDEPDEGRLLAALRAELDAAGVDLVYERYSLGGLATCRFAREHALPHVLEVNSPLVEEARRFRDRGVSAEDAAEEAWLFRHADRVLAVSEEVARYVRESGPREGPIAVRPNGVDTRVFRPREARDELRASLVPAGHVTIGFHGRVRPWHGFDLLARAFVELREAGLPVFLLCVGAGDFAAPLEAASRAAGLPVPAAGPGRAWHHVEWVEHDQVGRYVACFDVLPLAYSPDGPTYFSPLKLTEAMACGAVPLVPDVGEAARLVRHEENGLVYPAGDRPRLVAALRRLAAEPALAARLGAGAVRTARGRSWRGIAAEVLGWARVEGVA